MKRFAKFIENIAASAPHNRYPPVVAIDGALELPERVVALRGYDGIGPVRIGNAAYQQVQNDIYGQIIYALLQLYVDERFPRAAACDVEQLISTLLRIIEETASTIQMRASGSFAASGGAIATRRCVTGSARSQRRRSRARSATTSCGEQPRGSRRAQSALVEACYDSGRGAYMQEAGSKYHDASTLQLITLHYLDPHSERAARHLAVARDDLLAEGGLVHRYTHADDFGKPSAAFLVCSFWYVEALAAMGRLEAALTELEHLRGYANHLGLFSEDVDPATGSQWGNFPQAYSHVGLINAVLRISSKIDYPEFY